MSRNDTARQRLDRPLAEAPEAYARWREEGASAVTRVYEVSAPTADFHAFVTRRPLQGGSLAAFDYSGLTYARDARRIRADGYDDVFVQLTQSGGLDGVFDGEERAVGPETAVFADASLPILNRSRPTCGRHFIVPRRLFGGAELRGLHGRALSGQAYRLLFDYAAWLEASLRRASPAARERTEEAIAAVLLAVFHREAPVPEAALDDLRMLQLARLRGLLASHDPSRPQSIADLSVTLGLSRSALFRLAAPYGGVRGLQWSLRLEAARADLSNPRLQGRISDIAARHGFANGEHFARRFRDRYGFSPRNLRPF